MLAVKTPGLPVRVLTPISDTQFFDKLGGEWTFSKGSATEAGSYVLRGPRGAEAKGTKLPER